MSMWDYRTGANTLLTRKQAEALGIAVEPGAIGVRLKIEQIYALRFGGSIMFMDGFDYFRSSELDNINARWDKQAGRK